MQPKLIIEAGRSERQYWRDLWRYRELFAFLAWRDLLIRYKQTAVGVAWSLIRPFLTMMILTVMMKIADQKGDSFSPVPLFVFCGILPWQFFSTALAESGMSLVNNSNLISKVYFPRLVVPASSVITSFVDFSIAGAFTVLMMAWYGFAPPATIVFLPFFILLTFGASFGIGLWVSALMVKYRDFRFIVPFVVQFGLYATPVFKMTMNIHPDKLRLFLCLNPVVGIIDGFRYCLLGGPNVIYWPALGFSLAGVIILLWTGIWYFRKTERTFADVI